MPSAVPPWLVIARREFLERVRTIWFILVTLLGPMLMVGLIVVPAWLSVKSAEEEIRIEVVDLSDTEIGGDLVTIMKLADNLAVEMVDPATSQEVFYERIRTEKIDGYLELPEDILTGGTVIYRGANAANPGIEALFKFLVNDAVRKVRASHAGISASQIAALVQTVPVQALHTTGSSPATSGKASFFLGYAVMMILYMSILLYAVNVLRSVIQEKTNRVLEIIVSSVKPSAIMLGKILGVGAVGLFQLSVWAAMAGIIFRFREQVLGLFGIHGAGGFDLPAVTPGALIIALTYFLLGYFFYAAIYAAIGAMVNSEQEAQQAQTPVVLLLIIPVLCVQLVANDPRGGVAEALTLIPFSSPVLMPMRYLLDGASAGDVALSLGILLVSLAGVVFLASRIYRVGILMYGKRPTLRELGRWLRYS